MTYINDATVAGNAPVEAKLRHTDKTDGIDRAISGDRLF
jgi:hypothetical protein